MADDLRAANLAALREDVAAGAYRIAKPDFAAEFRRITRRFEGEGERACRASLLSLLRSFH